MVTDGLVLPALRAGQHDLRPQRQDLRGLRPPRPPLQLVPLGIGQGQPGLAPARTRAVSQPAWAVPGEPPPPLAHRFNGKPLRTRGLLLPRRMTLELWAIRAKIDEAIEIHRLFAIRKFYVGANYRGAVRKLLHLEPRFSITDRLRSEKPAARHPQDDISLN